MKPIYILELILDQFLKIDKFQDYVNRKCNTRYGNKIVWSSQNTTIEEVFSEYKFYDLQENDIVMDIGANVGGFAMFVSKTVKQVYAIEPITLDLLKSNIILNNINNISVINKCLGNGVTTVEWMGKHYERVGSTLTELIASCGGHVDFLKCDCEGGEWSIQSEELKDIRRLEIEVHNTDGKHNFDDFLKMLDKAEFNYTYQIRTTDMLVHAKKT